jgi:hypothetical protein
VIRHRYEQFARGERPRALGADGRFDRRIQAELLLDGIAALGPAAASSTKPYASRQE